MHRSMSSSINNLTVDCRDPRVLAEFWTAALGWLVVDEDDEGVMIAPFAERQPGVFPVYFASNPDNKVVKNRWHFDLAPDDQAAEVARLEWPWRSARRHRPGRRAVGRHGRRRGQRVLRAHLAAKGGGGVKVAFVAGFGPIVREADAAHAFWRDGLGIALEEAAPGYFTNDDLDGVKAFAMWPLSQAAEATFGTAEWPADVPAPQAWIELDVESAEAVGEGVAEMQAAGHGCCAGRTRSRGARRRRGCSARKACSSASRSRPGCTGTTIHTTEKRGPSPSESALSRGPHLRLVRALLRLVFRERLGRIDVAEGRMSRQDLFPTWRPNAELLHENRGQRRDLHVAEAGEGGDAPLQIAPVGQPSVQIRDASPSYVLAMYEASSCTRRPMAAGNRWTAGGPLAADSTSATSMTASALASSVPSRSFRTFGAEKAHCTGTCWSSAKPIRSAIGSSTRSRSASWSPVKWSRSVSVEMVMRRCYTARQPQPFSSLADAPPGHCGRRRVHIGARAGIRSAARLRWIADCRRSRSTRRGRLALRTRGR